MALPGATNAIASPIRIPRSSMTMGSVGVGSGSMGNVISRARTQELSAGFMFWLVYRVILVSRHRVLVDTLALGVPGRIIESDDCSIESTRAFCYTVRLPTVQRSVRCRY